MDEETKGAKNDFLRITENRTKTKEKHPECACSALEEFLEA